MTGKVIDVAAAATKTPRKSWQLELLDAASAEPNAEYAESWLNKCKALGASVGVDYREAVTSAAG